MRRGSPPSSLWATAGNRKLSEESRELKGIRKYIKDNEAIEKMAFQSTTHNLYARAGPCGTEHKWCGMIEPPPRDRHF